MGCHITKGVTEQCTARLCLTLPQVGKKIFKAVAPVLLDEGRQLLTRKKNVKQAVKSVAKCSKSNVINTGKEALRQEIARYQKGEGLINTKARQTGRLKRRSTC